MKFNNALLQYAKKGNERITNEKENMVKVAACSDFDMLDSGWNNIAGNTPKEDLWLAV